MANHPLLVGALPPLLSVDELARLLGYSPNTVRKNISQLPDTLPPLIRIGKRRLWVTAIAMAWMRDEQLLTPIAVDISGLPASLDDAALACLLHLSPKSLASMKCRGSGALPPGGRHGWETTGVFDWLIGHLVGLPPHTTIQISRPVFRLPVMSVSTTPTPTSLCDMLLASARQHRQ